MEKLCKERVHNYQHSNRTHGFWQNRWKCIAIVTNPEVKQMCIPREYIINSKFIKNINASKHFRSFSLNCSVILLKGPKGILSWTSLSTPVILERNLIQVLKLCSCDFFSHFLHSFQFFL